MLWNSIQSDCLATNCANYKRVILSSFVAVAISAGQVEEVWVALPAIWATTFGDAAVVLVFDTCWHQWLICVAITKTDLNLEHCHTSSYRIQQYCISYKIVCQQKLWINWFRCATIKSEDKK